ncbi:hypothetical protein ABW21_db0200609 [Orbilia brochopaga]|nr:hypothetical protein ABW21_db0200609 [Drechslerella brochopaga]
MSRDLFGDFGDFQAASTTSNNTFAAPTRPKSQNFSDLLGLFDAKPASTTQYPGVQHAPSGVHASLQSGLAAPRPSLQAASSEAIISSLAFKSTTPQPSTTLFTTSPQLHAVGDDDDDFGDFAEEPLPSGNPTFGPFTNYSASPPPQPSAPPPPPSADLAALASPQSPPPSNTRLLSTDTRVKAYFTSLLLTAHVAGRLIASKRIRARRPYKSSNIASSALSRPSKTSLAKDDREIAECVREYADLVGSLRAVVRGMGLQVPDLSLDMPISTSTATTTTNASNNKRKTNNIPGKDEFCWLCGLSPLDKILKIKEDDGALGDDTDITGKQRWTAGWGHRSCKNWWDACAKEVKY